MTKYSEVLNATKLNILIQSNALSFSALYYRNEIYDLKNDPQPIDYRDRKIQLLDTKLETIENCIVCLIDADELLDVLIKLESIQND